jgi:predicted DNA-binding transcriptional regulator YafY
VPVDFDFNNYFGNAWGVFRGDTTYDVELHFTKDAAKQVAETRWHHTQKVENHKDGSVTLKFKVDGLDEILWWLLGWAGFVKVVRPVALRNKLVTQFLEGIQINNAEVVKG